MHQISSFRIVFIISDKWVKYFTGKFCINLQLDINLLIVKKIHIALIYLYFLKIILKIIFIPAPLHSSSFDFFFLFLLTMQSRCKNFCLFTNILRHYFLKSLFILFICYSTKFKKLLANANKTINQNI